MYLCLHHSTIVAIVQVIHCVLIVTNLNSQLYFVHSNGFLILMQWRDDSQVLQQLQMHNTNDIDILPAKTKRTIKKTCPSS